jgi:hypothetical protein
MGKKSVSKGARKRAARKAARQRRRQAWRAAYRARKVAEFKSLMAEVFGPKIMATSRELPGPVRVRANKRPVAMHQVYMDTGEPQTTEAYRATFAGDGRRWEVEFELDPDSDSDSDKEIRSACYEAAELTHGPTARGWYLIKVEGTNALGKAMVR